MTEEGKLIFGGASNSTSFESMGASIVRVNPNDGVPDFFDTSRTFSIKPESVNDLQPLPERRRCSLNA